MWEVHGIELMGGWTAAWTRPRLMEEKVDTVPDMESISRSSRSSSAANPGAGL